MLLRVIDVETTGEPPHAKVCEAAWTDVLLGDGEPVISKPVARLYDPGIPMPPDARGVHHISDHIVKGASRFSALDLAPTAERWAFVAHRAEFERAFVTMFASSQEVDWICTWKAALRLFPDAPNHKNQTLRYLLGFDDKLGSAFTELAMPPHRAGPDSFVTAHLVVAMLKLTTIENLIAWTKEPALLARITFGTKHNGEPWSAADADYLHWIIEKSELDSDTKWNASHELDRRAALVRADYLAKALQEIEKIPHLDELITWFRSRTDERGQAGVLPTTSEYQQIVAACSKRKGALTSPAS